MTGLGDSSDKVREQQNTEKKLLQQFNSNTQRRPEIFKQLTGVEYTPENLEKFIKGEIKLKSEIALQSYKEGQEMATDVGADIVSGIAAVGIYSAAVAAAPFTGGASIAVGIAAAGTSAAAIKTGLKAADAISGGRKYTLKDATHDATTGAFSGILAPVTGGLGGAVGKTVATKLGIQAVKQVGKEVVEETAKGGIKTTVKNILTNPTGYEYIGGTALKQTTAKAAEMAADGAISGSVDNAFRTAYDGGSVTDILKAAGEGFVGGAILSPVIGGGMKVAGNIGPKMIYKELPFGELPADVPQIVIPKKTSTDLYPASDAAELAKMKNALREYANGLENIELEEITAQPYQKEVVATKTKEKFCIDPEAKDLQIGEQYKIIRTQNDGTYTIYKATQSGSNPGFWVEHNNSGDLYYFKTGNGQQNITEHVASQLYKAAGIDTPDMNLVAAPGFNNNIGVDNCWIKSKAITGLTSIQNDPKLAYEGFAVDAWLANWDAVCSGNTCIKNGSAVRLDFGGTLNFRARGAKKSFGNQVPELSTLLDPKINPESARIFKNMSREDLIKSLERVQSVTNDDIQNLYNSVRLYVNPEIFSTIQNRKNYLGYILNEAKHIDVKPNESISDYVKRVEEIVATKYKLPIKKMNTESEKRIRIMNNLIEQRNQLSNEDNLAIWDYKGSTFTANTCIQRGDLNNPLVTKLDQALDKTSLPEDIILYRGDHFIIDSHTNLRYASLFPEFNGCSFYKMREVSPNNWIYDKDAPAIAQKHIDNEQFTYKVDMDEIIKKIFKKGKVIKEEQFVSTTVSPNVAQDFGSSQTDIIYRFKAPKGTKATSPEKLDPANYGRDKALVIGNLTGRLEGSEAEILLKRGFSYRMDNLKKENGKYIIECTILK